MNLIIIYLLVFISAFISVITIIGNILVMIAVRFDVHLRENKTNHFIVSLAVADLLIGMVVTPFAIYDDFTSRSSAEQTSLQVWPFGDIWCDFWHALDILCSTASILSLCAISLERYWAISNPMTYPVKLTNRLSFSLIGIIWICSSVISFPAILWWRSVSPPKKNLCLFTEDPSYLILSSLISFYIPLSIMIVLYAKIYRTANELSISVKRGAKILHHQDGTKEDFIIRVHRGGGSNHYKNSSFYSSSQIFEKTDFLRVTNNSPTDCFDQYSNHENTTDTILAPSIIPRKRPYPVSVIVEASDMNNSQQRGKLGSLLYDRFANLRKFLREQKTIRSLALIMGIFIICWFPFFSCNIIQALFPRIMGSYKPVIMNIVNWLGYTNSAINPIIYAYSMRDFRRAFVRILTCGRRNNCLGKQVTKRSKKKHIQIDYRLRAPLVRKCHQDCASISLDVNSDLLGKGERRD